ncbi:fatty acid/phospholipid synthesis protein PlsX [Candidatus Phytoplasma oryzae]|uniref:Phosphate acyltransferase n=1 Tax=Candidatus Phytoplasma oryzae TaxID=203274 RepID=A0A139JQP5_9MOLU|nr:phosphate acyltransferase PlsX [Candidatus Phytoplasma oryzae]KXT29293.1 fatty acid/phospholipid synthesis protein PlsX [Candidatus Phytoplasma oryzae]RAM57671.1 phosphate acyltransferase [Candidatus Phytoplasma oryzae]
MIKLAIDAMGGDLAPEVVVKGVCKALKEEKLINIFLYGDQKKINYILNHMHPEELPKEITKKLFIIHTDYSLKMDIKNIREELRDNPHHSMFLALQAAKKNKVEGVISAGPTQALVLSSYLIIGTINYLNRIALAPIFCSLKNNKKKIILDAGANIDIQPKKMVDFAICASVLAKELFKISKPMVKLLNIGKESMKGRNFEKETFNLLNKEKSIFFGGNEEPNNVLNSEADILLSDGFTTNILLKSYEGAIETLTHSFKEILSENFFKRIISGFLFKKKIKEFKKKIDNKELGGAILLGLKKTVIKVHGNTDAYSFYKSILQAKSLIEKNIFIKINERLNNNE